MQPSFNRFIRHFFVLVFLAVVALLYFHPVLQGKAIYQSDIVQYRGMAREQTDFREETGEEPYWTNSAFGGMPTYQLGARFPNDYLKMIDRGIRFLPRPADYLFLYMLGFYILMCCLKVDYRLAVLGALAYGFSTYLIIILGVGHNAKAHALGYLPPLLGGLVLIYRNRYLWGAILTAVAMAFEIMANHYQMTYYFMLLAGILGLVYGICAIRNRAIKPFLLATAVAIGSLALGVLPNATALLTTQEYAAWSTRGPSALTLDPEGNPLEATEGLDKEYITQYSYGIFESLNIFVPRLLGGGTTESLGDGSRTYAFLIDQGVPRSQALEFTENLQYFYWGEQPSVAAPAYVGALVVFLFLLGIFLVRGRARWWLVAGALMSLFLSWGKNFGLLTDFLIDYFPLYDKFRAVSSAQVILELCFPVLGILALHRFINPDVPQADKKKALVRALAVAGSLAVALLLLTPTLDFTGGGDAILSRYFGEEVVSVIRRDREAVYIGDSLRSLLIVMAAGAMLWLYFKKKMGSNVLILALAVVLLLDLVGVDKRYVNADDFVAERRMNAPIAQSQADQAILQDTTVFRVLNLNEGINGARTSYFHHSLGGYHAAKPRRLQDLFEYHIYRDNRRVLNMLNTKYLIQDAADGTPSVSLNPGAAGNAWFVEDLVSVADADAAIRALDTLDILRVAVVNRNDFPDRQSLRYPADSAASIRLTQYQPNYLKYLTSNRREGLAVFSEMYYPQGWQAYIDGKPRPHFRVNYALRALEIPAGSHTVEFRFQPEVVARGSRIAMAGYAGLLLLILGGISGRYYFRRRSKQSAA